MNSSRAVLVNGFEEVKIREEKINTVIFQTVNGNVISGGNHSRGKRKYSFLEVIFPAVMKDDGNYFFSGNIVIAQGGKKFAVSGKKKRSVKSLAVKGKSSAVNGKKITWR